jgi:hypothetical protein
MARPLLNPDRWDVDALRAGASVALVFAVPFQVLAALFVDEGEGGLGALLFFGTVLGFVLGGGCAAWLQRLDLPLSHGILTTMGTYLAAQAVLLVVALVRGSDINLIAIMFTLTLTAGAGLVGGFLGKRLRAKGFVPRARIGDPS